MINMSTKSDEPVERAHPTEKLLQKRKIVSKSKEVKKFEKGVKSNFFE